MSQIIFSNIVSAANNKKPHYEHVGGFCKSKDAEAKSHGEISYAVDFTVPNMLFGVAVRSNIPHGNIIALDCSLAEKAPGVVKILTAKDIPGLRNYGYIYCDTPVLAYDKVRCIGDTVALIIADTLEHAQEATSLVRVEYEALPGLFTPDEALAEGAAAIHENGNLLKYSPLCKGDAVAASKQAAFIVQGVFETPRQAHMYLEQECSIAAYDAQGVLNVYSSTQDIFSDRDQIARVLKLQTHKVRVIQLPTGGGFGGKIDVTTEILAALAAYHVKNPVKVMFSRQESMYIAPKRHPMRFALSLGADENGKLMFLSGDIISDNGAYASMGDKVTRKCMASITGPYYVPNLAINGYTVYTNNPQAGAMRGFGMLQASFAFDSLLDMLAEKMGVDSWQLRKKNLLTAGNTNAVGQVVSESIGIAKTMDAAMAYLQKHPLHEASTADKESGLQYGLGCGNAMFLTGLGFGRADTSTVLLTLNEDGTYQLLTGSMDLGQGSSAVFAILAAEFLGVNPEDIHIVTSDTGITPSGGPATATRQTFVTGRAVQDAAKNMLQLLQPLLVEMLHINEADSKPCLELKNGKIYLDNIEQKISFADVAKAYSNRPAIRSVLGFCDNTTEPENPETMQGKAFSSAVYGTQLVELLVDRHTGEVRILRIIAAFDVGKALNPRMVEGQIEGGVAMSVGYTLSEQMLIEQGIINNPEFSSYLIPTAMDVPDIVSLIIEEADTNGPLGAKGIGEPPLLGVPAAIANAIKNAVGVRMYSLPITRQDLVKKLL